MRLFDRIGFASAFGSYHFPITFISQRVHNLQIGYFIRHQPGSHIQDMYEMTGSLAAPRLVSRESKTAHAKNSRGQKSQGVPNRYFTYRNLSSYHETFRGLHTYPSRMQTKFVYAIQLEPPLQELINAQLLPSLVDLASVSTSS